MVRENRENDFKVNNKYSTSPGNTRMPLFNFTESQPNFYTPTTINSKNQNIAKFYKKRARSANGHSLSITHSNKFNNMCREQSVTNTTLSNVQNKNMIDPYGKNKSAPKSKKNYL